MNAGSFDWIDQAEGSHDAVRSLASHPGAIALVEAMRRTNGERTSRIRVNCRDHDSGAAFSLGVSDGLVTVVWAPGSPLMPRPVLSGAEDGSRHVLVCQKCGQETGRNSAWILREALRCLAVRKENPRTRLALKWTA